LKLFQIYESIVFHRNFALEAKLHKARFIIMIYTSSAVLAIASKPMYAKKAVAELATIPFTPNGKYLLLKQEINIIQ
jgi:hypothetical protein